VVEQFMAEIEVVCLASSTILSSRVGAGGSPAISVLSELAMGAPQPPPGTYKGSLYGIIRSVLLARIQKL
jgi:hypothetical protein